MAIGLYTSRKILEILGVDDFGLLNVVGGVIAMVAFLNNSMSASTQRFLTYELGKKEEKSFNNIFSMCVLIHLVIGFLALLLGETVGLWLVNTQLNIDPDRMVAANFIYQTAILSAVLGIIQTPYNAAIISYERMHIYAYVGLGESVTKLVIVFLLLLSPVDHLITYAILLFAVQLTTCLNYRIYCIRNLDGCRMRRFWNRGVFRHMLSFTGWNMFGATAALLRDSGANILLNIFGGTAVNAARGVAYTLSNAANTLVGGFQSALNPQLTKSYASDNYEATCSLLCRSSKISYILMLIITIPVFLECQFLLDLWLVEVPHYTVMFARIILLESLVATLQGPMITALLATGNIRWYQIVVGGLFIMNVPIAYILLKSGGHIVTPFIVSLVLVIVGQMLRLRFAHNMLRLSYKKYAKEVILPIVLVSVTSAVVPVTLAGMLNDGWLRLIVVTVASMISVGASCWIIAFDYNEKAFIREIVETRLNHLKSGGRLWNIGKKLVS